MRIRGVYYLLASQDSVARHQRWDFAPVAQVAGLTVLRNLRARPLGVVLACYLTVPDFTRLDSTWHQ